MLGMRTKGLTLVSKLESVDNSLPPRPLAREGVGGEGFFTISARD